MTIKETLYADIKTAMISKDIYTKNKLNLVKASILEYEKVKGKEVTDNDVIGFISAILKGIRENIVRTDNVPERREQNNEYKKELELYLKYMPAQLTDEQVQVKINETINSLGKNIGAVIGNLSNELAGSVDKKKLSEMVKKTLESQ